MNDRRSTRRRERAVRLLAMLAVCFTTMDGRGKTERAEIEAWHRAYVAALNAHDVDAVLRFYDENVVRRSRGEVVSRTRDALRDVREWEAPMRARFEYEIVSVRGEWLMTRQRETNAIYDALDVRRPQVSQFRWRDNRILEMRSKEIREAGRTWRDALAELEDWLARLPAARRAGVLRDGRLAFTDEGGRLLAPLLAEYRKVTDTARARHEPVLRSYVAGLNRQGVDAPPSRWSYTILGGGPETLEVLLTEDMEFYDLLGVGSRSHRALFRFRDDRIVQERTWEWTQQGRPYEGARDAFAAWAVQARPDAAGRFVRDGQVVLDATTVPLIGPLVREWRAATTCRIYHPSFNSSGTQIAFSSDCEGPWGIYVMESDGSRPRRVTPRGVDARLPNWSPDDTMLVYQSNSAGNWDIYTVRADGTEVTRRTHGPGASSSGAFSPDGTRILFASDRAGLNDLFVVPVTGGAAVPITKGSGAGFRSIWSPDGAHVLYRASRPATADQGVAGEFLRVRPDGRDAGRVAGGPRHEYNPSYSPDGASIAFDAHRSGGYESADGGWEIWTMRADGSDRRRLTRNEVNDWGPSWSPDGKTIVYLSGRNNVYDIHTMNGDGSNVRRVTCWTSACEGRTARLASASTVAR